MKKTVIILFFILSGCASLGDYSTTTTGEMENAFSEVENISSWSAELKLRNLLEGRYLYGHCRFVSLKGTLASFQCSDYGRLRYESVCGEFRSIRQIPIFTNYYSLGDISFAGRREDALQAYALAQKLCSE